ncbi:MAG TPA: ATP-binding protein [Acidobacteriaceae bacterium]|nr:ATP-binding protein [Acidobacteriaceae bacterium]
MDRKRVLVSWSGGKDSAWALHLLLQRRDVEVVGLLTTINTHFGRVAMHGFREELLERQAEAAGLPLWRVPLPWPCSNEQYEAAMSACCARAVADGVHAIAFGDLFLEDIRAYREARLAGTGLEPIFPCWQIPTDELAREMIAAGVRAHLVCVDPRQLDRGFAGRLFDDALLKDLPVSVDPCGERGEFHTFVNAGPMFARSGGSRSIEVRRGEIVERDGFVYADLLPAQSSSDILEENLAPLR